jgi:hypothetical protein
MHLEFLADGADECPLLRFFRWCDGEASLLREAAEQLVTGASRSIEVHKLPFIKAVGDIRFTWVADAYNCGVSMPDDKRSFVMRLPSELWADVAEIIHSFKRGAVGFNWLLPVIEVKALLSHTGQW